LTRAARTLPLFPPLALLWAIASHAVNVPRWDDWGVIPFVVALRDGSLTIADFWAQHNEHRIAAVKLILVPLMLATDFDVTAMMYAGFGLQLGAFALLWSLLKSTVGATDGRAALALAVVVSLLMFSPAQDEVWLWGLPSLQWHLCNLTAAAAVWLTASRISPWLWLPACFLLTCAGMLAVASGIMLWGVILAAIVTDGIVSRRRLDAALLIAWAAGAVALVAAYFTGLRPSATATDPSYFLGHPLEFVSFVLVYLGSPFLQGADLRWSRIVGLGGILAFAGAVYAVAIRRVLQGALPWLWLSLYALMVAVATAVGRTQTGILTATTNRYTTGSWFFWIGLLVIAAMMMQRLWRAGSISGSSALKAVAAAAAIAGALDYAWLYRRGYQRFVATHNDRQTALAELWAYQTAPDEALALLYPPSPEAARSYARILESRGLGPFSSRMLRGRPEREAIIRPAGHVRSAAGALETAQCTVIAGWAWDKEQPDVPVEVDIYEGRNHIGKVTAYWYRRDLAAAGMGRGRHAFLFTPPSGLKDGRTRRIRARISGTDTDLAGSPATFACSDTQAILWR
jgi:hypothetical protein